MSARAHGQLEAILADALRAADPVAALRRAARRPGLPAGMRRALLLADEDGVRLTALLVARLRFERLVQGSARAAQWFEDDAAGFTEAFRRYHQAVPLVAFFPREEARQFEAWCAAA